MGQSPHHTQLKTVTMGVCLLILTSCTTSGSEDKPPTYTLNQLPPPTMITTIEADGIGSGKDIYTIITDALGDDAIEAPDLYPNDHHQVKHLYEDYDHVVGNHWAMTLHRDLDGNKGVFKGRQRNEIKVYGHSPEGLKGYEHSTFNYTWKMKINSEMEVSRRFTHFFQLKPKGGDDGTPTFTLTGAERKGNDVLEIRYQVPTAEKQILASLDWTKIRGQWLTISLTAHYANHGFLALTISPVSDAKPLVALSIDDIDLWIGERSDHYQRPKWGIVRSIEDKDNLRADEEIVRFADLKITRY